ncbi:MAG: hypothetical protein P8I46_00460 [Pseudomonadales bacterium]|jgi:hypothetical protein|nr:hypothetical protein [Pseudomonadales bacterium]
MKKITSTLVTTIALIGSAWAFASEEAVITIGGVEMENSSSSEAFEAVKKKLGRWEGQMTQSLTGETFDVSYEWAVTSGGNTITETITEDGVEMLTTYSDQDGEMVVKHYCGLGTEPVFQVSELSANSMSIAVDEQRSGLHKGHHSFVTGMKWTMDANNPNSMVFENTVVIDGEETSNRAELKRTM